MTAVEEEGRRILKPEPAGARSFKSKLVRDDVTWRCFLVFLCCCMVTISGLVFINATGSYVILDILEYPREKLGVASGTLALSDEILCIPMVTFWGFLSDRLGRRPVMTAGLAFMAVAIWLYPWAGSVFPSSPVDFFKSLLFFRLVFALGGSACTAMITALIGDYAVEGGRAKVAGCTGTAAAFGALFAALLLARLPLLYSKGLAQWFSFSRPDIVLTFSTTSIVILLTAVLSFFFLGSPSSILIEAIPWTRRLKTGFMAIRNPVIALAYLAGFVARADSIALTLFIGPWVDNYLTRAGICPPRSDALVRCPQAKRLTSNLMSTSHLATLLGAPLFGILSDRLGPVKAVALPSLLGLLSFGAMTMIRNPASPLIYFAMFCAGLADIGMIISSMALISSQSGPSQRGALAGVYSLFGALGIIVTSQLGGWLFDGYFESASFFAVAAPSGLLFVLILLTILVNPKPQT